MAATPTSSAVAPEAGAPPTTAPADVHPAYSGEFSRDLSVGFGFFLCFVWFQTTASTVMCFPPFLYDRRVCQGLPSSYAWRG